jgi:hypothetical protein
MPAIEPNMLRTVFYIYPSKEDADNSRESGGTGFFFRVPSEVDSNLGFFYGVTCRHVIDDCAPNPVLRFNTEDGGFETLETKIDDWTPHPDGDDVAIISITIGSNYTVGNLVHEHVLTKEFIEEKGVNVGDEVFMIGRFRVHAGKKKNKPAAMFGYISMMADPDEPIKIETGEEFESYLVEMRSIPGFSGSPVILWIPPFSKRWSTNELTPNMHYRLLGVCWRYINVKELATDDLDKNYRLKLNSAMAAVVPAQKIMDLIDSKEQIEMRKKENDKLRKNIKESGLSESSYSEKTDSKSEGITKEEFEDALRKIARPLKKDDQAKKGKEE